MFEKCTGYVVIVDINGYTDMKVRLPEDQYIQILEDFFGCCEGIIDSLTNFGGGGYIIGDGAIFFLQESSPDVALNLICDKIYAELRAVFRVSQTNLCAAVLYSLSFAAGYCDFFVRRNCDLVGPEVDELFTIMKNSTDETLHLSQRLVSVLDGVVGRRLIETDVAPD
jgi:hypothetical protein